ncbi:unnamed protein product [Ectocarpus sp. 13 AM-2016]
MFPKPPFVLLAHAWLWRNGASKGALGGGAISPTPTEYHATTAMRPLPAIVPPPADASLPAPLIVST